MPTHDEIFAQHSRHSKERHLFADHGYQWALDGRPDEELVRLHSEFHATDGTDSPPNIYVEETDPPMFAIPPVTLIRFSLTGETLWEIYGRAERELSKFVGVFPAPFRDPRMQRFDISVRGKTMRKGELSLWEAEITVEWLMTD